MKCDKIFQVQRSKYVKYKTLEFLLQAQSTLVFTDLGSLWTLQPSLKAAKCLPTPGIPSEEPWPAPPKCVRLSRGPGRARVEMEEKVGCRVLRKEFQAGSDSRSCSAENLSATVTQGHPLPSQSKII